MIPTVARAFTNSARSNRHVAVLGANGGIGQPLSLLCKLNNSVTKLSLLDLKGAPGVAADLSHIPTTAQVKGFNPENIGDCLKGAEVVIIPAGVPRKPGMTRDDLFNTNASIVRDLVKSVAEHAPKASIQVVSNPVNSTVPIAAEVLKKAGVFDANKLFGVTTLDVTRASTFIAESSGKPSEGPSYNVPVYGGHSGKTILPLISQATPNTQLQKEAHEALVNRIQFGGDEVVKAKDGAGSATLSMAFAAAKFADEFIQGLNGKAITVPSFVNLNHVQGGKEVQKELGKDLEYFSVPVTLGPNGVEKVSSIGQISDYEKQLFSEALDELAKNIEKGVSFANSN
ncbi:hypothetical protein E3P92_02901 [Wallemia ichthyophaga]|uniref:Malate dehydrogenase n=3 Tax=Wallemia ichthyophaga TaxID=245174 RepID=A0A4T0K1D6_WALIC|nr:uncharacterized protein J056_002821 [Wallemia ichthyophaga EXF-994]TIA70896.1 hypothetical protein E3P91_02817 [Wallemia ichthyophaga]EOQ98784.1 hypothetical protein J056_002821 [Wallemia ichthyophaga EXF-994]TIA80349.1 hypothetical protein E3P98_02751 [Wallemia ichthyophaga]TIA90135.1 hypothetical protein E3P97_02683 [Wallemia ichthyophaga]TIA97388.1 hypothetical protein E3P95_02883 [Wallemia ichthyophaga]